MSEERQQLIAQKRRIAYAKNMLKHISGITVQEFYGQDENIRLNKMYEEYILSNYKCLNAPQPYSKLHYKSPDSLCCSWIMETMKLQKDGSYFLYCGPWAKIKITDVSLMVQSLWEESSRSGFLLAEGDLSRILEVGFDSRDEENYLIDIWEYHP